GRGRRAGRARGGGGGAAGAAPPAEAVEHDLEALQAKAAERDEYLALAQRTQADFENYRKRAARDVQAAQDRGAAKVVKELLPALDNLERAIAAAEEQEGDEHHLTAGIRLVHRELIDALGRLGIETISPKGEAFDPNVHEAMSSQPVEGAESGTVVEVYQQGYRLNGLVIRPARVAVAA
ncbi:MAG: nucleotide exchange factor GrpE, partial [Solirubrobacteraceae bacterium]|nr:nucleotide exchange factor GrpE [Solirubrobacteraceae bacterium]